MEYVTDTHALIWYMTNDAHLSRAAKRVLNQERVVIPCISFFEILYLLEKKRLSVDFDAFISQVTSSSNYRVEPMCLPIIKQCRKISRDRIPDPWDRVIAATSLHLNCPLISRDFAFKDIGVDLIW